MAKNANCLLFHNYVPIRNKLWYLLHKMDILSNSKPLDELYYFYIMILVKCNMVNFLPGYILTITKIFYI